MLSQNINNRNLLLLTTSRIRFQNYVFSPIVFLQYFILPLIQEWQQKNKFILQPLCPKKQWSDSFTTTIIMVDINISIFGRLSDDLATAITAVLKLVILRYYWLLVIHGTNLVALWPQVRFRHFPRMRYLSFTGGFLQYPLGDDPIKLRLAETTTIEAFWQLFWQYSLPTPHLFSSYDINQ